MNLVERLHDVVVPVLADLEVSLYDLEYAGGTLRVLIDREGGIGLDDITVVSRLVSRALDEADEIPGSYTLEVSSPGLERPLRTPEHFRAALGLDVTVKGGPHVDQPRRVTGVLTAADDDTITVTDSDGDARTLAYGDISKARTVFDWAADRSEDNRSARPAPSQKARTR